MVTSAEASAASPPPDPVPPPSRACDLFSFPILKPRSKRRPAKFPPPSSDKASAVTDEPEALQADERRWNLRSARSCAARSFRMERPRFSVALSTDEIEEDIYSVTGSRPRRRPKKRPRVVQKQIDVSSNIT